MIWCVCVCVWGSKSQIFLATKETLSQHSCVNSRQPHSRACLLSLSLSLSKSLEVVKLVEEGYLDANQGAHLLTPFSKVKCMPPHPLAHSTNPHLFLFALFLNDEAK